LFLVDPHLIQKIVELPISLIISLNPDAVLKKAFKQFQLPYQFSFFSIENTIDNGEIKEITADNPLIYNLWGSVDHHDSIILDYEDIFKLMELLNRNLEAPNAKIKSVLKEAQNFICIGFRFDIWYTHWLLRYLNMYEKEFNNNTTNYLVKTTLHSEDIKIFLYKQFNVQFISAGTSFLEELHRRYADYLRFQPDEAAPMRKINDAHLNIPMKSPYKLLFLGAAPLGTPETNTIRAEHSHIQEQLEKEHKIAFYEFFTEFYTSTTTLQEHIIKKAPHIIHFSMVSQPIKEGVEEGIVLFDGSMRRKQVIPLTALDDLFDLFCNIYEVPLKIVVLNGCFSTSQAETIGKYVNYVVGTLSPIPHEAAISFASGFYFGLCQEKDIETAFQTGRSRALSDMADLGAYGKELFAIYKKGKKITVGKK
jgi:hypothetical protein